MNTPHQWQQKCEAQPTFLPRNLQLLPVAEGPSPLPARVHLVLYAAVHDSELHLRTENQSALPNLGVRLCDGDTFSKKTRYADEQCRPMAKLRDTENAHVETDQRGRGSSELNR